MTSQAHKPILPLPDQTVRNFWLKADRPSDVECWPWRGGKNDKGYGRLALRGRAARSVLAHRAAWAITNDRDPGPLCVLHHCDNPPCINPAHLFLGTISDNWRDCIAKGRARFPNPPQPHCRNGHPYTAENTIFEGRNHIRRCRECKRLRCQRKSLKKKEMRHATRP